MLFKLVVGEHTYNPSILEAEEQLEVKVMVGCIVSLKPLLRLHET